MPTAITDSESTCNLKVNMYDRVSSFPPEVWRALEQDAVQTNPVLPLAQKSLYKEKSAIGMPVDETQYWITCASLDAQGKTTLEFVLSCTNNDLGEYPIFIVTTLPFSRLTEGFLHPRIEALIQALLDVVPVERVYSIFAPEPISKLFASLWTEATGIASIEQAYYEAKLSYCNRATFVDRQFTLPVGMKWNVRPAVETDLRGVAHLCLGFSQESEPFVLNWQGALKEARSLIHNKQVWVHEVQRGTNPPEIACIAAFTRNTTTTATITKVMTDPSHRGLKCAQRLVRQVCKNLLRFQGKQSVALYVAHSNGPANRVYHNVGFVGLDGEHAEGVESWSEIGFDRNVVQLGHW